MSRTLVLNASAEPFAVVPLNDAIVHVVMEKADVLEETDKPIRSQHLTMKAPSVIQLRKYVVVPYRKSAKLTTGAVLARDNYICGYCEKEASERDHIMPTSRGGKNVWLNVIAACRKCNHRKADYTLDEMVKREGAEKWRLKFEPTTPKGIQAWMLTLRLDKHPDWQPYF